MVDYDIIIFDMDGVLFDTEQYYFDRRKRFLAQHGISIDHLEPSFFIGGNTKQVWEAILGDDYDKWDVASLQKDYTQYKLDNPLPYKELVFDDTIKVVKRLKEEGKRLGLASSSLKSDILKALEIVGLTTYFDVVLSGEEFAESKPNPAIYLEAVKQLEVSSEDVLVVEDSEKGIQAAVSAGLTVWAVKDTRFGMNQSKADRLIERLDELI